MTSVLSLPFPFSLAFPLNFHCPFNSIYYPLQQPTFVCCCCCWFSALCPALVLHFFFFFCGSCRLGEACVLFPTFSLEMSDKRVPLLFLSPFPSLAFSNPRCTIVFWSAAAAVRPRVQCLCLMVDTPTTTTLPNELNDSSGELVRRIGKDVPSRGWQKAEEHQNTIEETVGDRERERHCARHTTTTAECTPAAVQGSKDKVIHWRLMSRRCVPGACVCLCVFMFANTASTEAIVNSRQTNRGNATAAVGTLNQTIVLFFPFLSLPFLWSTLSTELAGRARGWKVEVSKCHRLMNLVPHFSVYVCRTYKFKRCWMRNREMVEL